MRRRAAAAPPGPTLPCWRRSGSCHRPPTTIVPMKVYMDIFNHSSFNICNFLTDIGQKFQRDFFQLVWDVNWIYFCQKVAYYRHVMVKFNFSGKIQSLFCQQSNDSQILASYFIFLLKASLNINKTAEQNKIQMKALQIQYI